MGVSHQRYYGIKSYIEEDGLEGLLEKSRKAPRLRNRVAPEIEQVILDHSLEFPTQGQMRVANELKKQGIQISDGRVRGIWLRHNRFLFRHPVKGRLRYAVSFFGLIDLLAILPFYLPFIGGDFRFVRAVRLFRLFRVLKLARYSFALSSVMGVLVKKREELLCTLFLLVLLLLFSSSLMYYVEGEAQPNAFSSIPMAMWWGVATLTTVGYGDVYPVTGIGKVLGAIIAVLGIGLFALPAGLIGGAYLEEVEERKNRKRLKESGQDPETPFGFGEGKSRHLMLDIWLKKDIDEASVDHILELVRNHFTILHEFEHTYSPHGFTKGFILSESHFFLHTYPESRFLSIDLYVCNPDVDLEALTRMFINGLEVDEEKYQIVFRGT